MTWIIALTGISNCDTTASSHVTSLIAALKERSLSESLTSFTISGLVTIRIHLDRVETLNGCPVLPYLPTSK